MRAGILSIFTHTPIHPGGSWGRGRIDQPVQRESELNLPIIQFTGVKGAVIDIIGKSESEKITFTDARLLLFPVYSSLRKPLWVTSDKVLKRLLEDVKAVSALQDNLDLPQVNENKGLSMEYSGKVMVGEKVFKIEAWKHIKKWSEFIKKFLPSSPSYRYINELISSMILVLPHSDNWLHQDQTCAHYSEFVSVVERGLDVRARVRIDGKSKTVKKGGLWFEENVPAETLFYSVYLYERDKPVLSGERTLWLGGCRGTGKGRVTVKEVFL